MLFLKFLWLTLFGVSAYSSDFVKVKGTQFQINDKPYYYIGANYWYGAHLGSSGNYGDRERLLRELDHLAAHGVKNLRIMAGSEGPANQPLRVQPAMQEAPGVYNQEVLEGLDFLLQEMAKRNMKAVMCLTNFWHWSGGMAQYVSWADKTSIPYPPPAKDGSWDRYQKYTATFYTNQQAKEAYNQHVRYIVNRTNSLTGLPYKNDPVIMSWELANEPRGMKQRSAYLKWIKDTVTLIKSLDANHLVTIGSEGDTPNPEYAGVRYLEDHKSSGIDYGTMHIWIENFGWYEPKKPDQSYPGALEKAKDYFNKHLKESETLGLPMVFEEFGIARDQRSMDPKSTTKWRDQYLATMFNQVLEAAEQGRAVAGANFWAYSGEGRPSTNDEAFWQLGDDLLGDPAHEPQGWYGVYNTDVSTFKIISDIAAKMDAIK